MIGNATNKREFPVKLKIDQINLTIKSLECFQSFLIFADRDEYSIQDSEKCQEIINYLQVIVNE